jgi:hypothetical protein
MAIIKAPFTEEQVKNLEHWQKSGFVHPFTCAKQGGGKHALLIPSKDGWLCPTCGYTQDWAHGYMANIKVEPPNYTT